MLGSSEEVKDKVLNNSSHYFHVLCQEPPLQFLCKFIRVFHLHSSKATTISSTFLICIHPMSSETSSNFFIHIHPCLPVSSSIFFIHFHVHPMDPYFAFFSKQFPNFHPPSLQNQLKIRYTFVHFFIYFYFVLPFLSLIYAPCSPFPTHRSPLTY